MRKKRLLPVFALIIIILSPFSSEGNSNKSKMLVLGFKSPLINDIQSRLLSERVLWDLQSRGYPIVPVMEYERTLRENPGSGPGVMDKKYLKNTCLHFNADYAVSGTLEAKELNRVISDIKPDIVYNCRLIIYSREKDAFTMLKLDVKGRDNYFNFFINLSGEIVPALEKSLRE